MTDRSDALYELILAARAATEDDPITAYKDRDGWHSVGDPISLVAAMIREIHTLLEALDEALIELDREDLRVILGTVPSNVVRLPPPDSPVQ